MIIDTKESRKEDHKQYIMETAKECCDSIEMFYDENIPVKFKLKTKSKCGRFKMTITTEVDD